MPAINKRLGIGATVSALARYLHPSRIIREKYGENVLDTLRIDGLLVINKEEKRIQNRKVVCVVCRHDDFPMEEINIAETIVKLVTPGNPSHYFIQEETRQTAPTTHPEAEFVAEERPSDVNQSNVPTDDIARLRDEGFEVDDDNEPAPENIPSANNNNDVFWYDWGFQGVDLRHEHGQKINQKAQIPLSDVYAEFNLFWEFLPKDFIFNVIIHETNKKLVKPMTKGEFSRWLGIILLMSTIKGFQRHEFWSVNDIDAFSGPPYRFGAWMSRGRFEEIRRSLVLTNEPVPDYKDLFYPIRQMIKEWNNNMADNFTPSWVSCLDESMCAWLSKWTCPGWMVVPRKPHPFGNEYHTICCALCGILYHLEIVEGKDRPAALGKKQYESEFDKTGGLLLRMTKAIHGTGKVVIMDSGFCVL
jgi:hypothetical protein